MVKMRPDEMGDLDKIFGSNKRLRDQKQVFTNLGPPSWSTTLASKHIDLTLAVWKELFVAEKAESVPCKKGGGKTHDSCNNSIDFVLEKTKHVVQESSV